MKNVLKALFLGLALFGAGIGVAWVTHSPSEESSNNTTNTSTSTSNSGEIATVVVSGNLKNGGDCHDHFTDDCELFQATINLDSGEVLEVKDLVVAQGTASFPKLSTDGSVLTYIATQNGKDLAMLLNMSSGETQVLSKAATHPFPSSDGKNAYLSLSNGFQLATVDLSNAILRVQSISGVMSAHEPQVSAKGLVAFYSLSQGESRGSGTAEAMVYVPSTGELIEVSGKDGTAHCYWNFDGSELYCNNRRGGGVLAYPIAEDGTAGDSYVALPFPSVQELGAIDPEFTAACATISVEYGAFCDADHLILTAGCNAPADNSLDQEFAQTVLYNLKTKIYAPLGYKIAQVYGTKGANTWTGTCALQ